MEKFSILFVFQIIILSVIEGVTEFLPISSTGHILIFEEAFKKLYNFNNLNDEFFIFFVFFIQLGAIFAVIREFWDDIFPFSGTHEEKKNKISLWYKIFLAIIPAIFIVKIDDKIEVLFYHTYPIAFALILYGLLLILIEKKVNKNSSKVKAVSEIPYCFALYIGVFQCLAVIPGTSRAAATIIGSMLLGLNRSTATRFSFYLAIPTIAGATLIKFFKIKNNFNINEIGYITIGVLISYFISLLVIRKFLNYIKKNNFIYFGYYRILLGVLIIVFLK